MAIRIQANFATGEMDPALFERGNLERFQNGLEVARNCVIGKTGRFISRMGRKIFIATKLSNRQVKIYSPRFTNYLIEWGHEYVRIHDLIAGNYSDDPHDLTEGDLPNIRFHKSGDFVYVHCLGKPTKKMLLGPINPSDPLKDNRFQDLLTEVFRAPAGPSGLAKGVSSTGSGYEVQYAATAIINGEESGPIAAVGLATLFPNAGEQNYIEITPPTGATEIRMYRRPFQLTTGGGAYGYIGSTTYASGGKFYFTDFGQEADYTNSPPSYDVSPWYLNGRTGIVYQKRLIVTEAANPEALHASRTGYPHNFSRDFPLNSDSQLTFKAGTSEGANVFHLMDNDGLLVFTSRGIYINQGALTPQNLFFDRRAGYVVDEKLPPIDTPDSIIFVDRKTNSVRSMLYSDQSRSFVGEDISIYSSHLLKGRRIVSWDFQDGDIPIIWAVLDDGTFLSCTFNREHQMQAWTRHDSQFPVEDVATNINTDEVSTTYMVTRNGTSRYIEVVQPRYQDDIKDLCLMDSAKSWKVELGAAAGGATFTLAPVTPGDWDGPLTLTASAAAFANTAGNGAVGTVFRYFATDGSFVDLEVTTYTSTTVLTVSPSSEFPSAQATAFTGLYKTYTSLTGLSYLNGLNVSVFADGNVVASPYNTDEDYDVLTPSGGTLNLPDRFAIIHVGLPFISDGKSLPLNTVEQRPTTLESKIVNKLYLKLYKSRGGLYIGSRLPEDDTVDGMQLVDNIGIDYDDGNEYDLLGNAPRQLETKRYEVLNQGEWKVDGAICWRCVDPLPYEILSLIPDVTVEDGARRGG